MRWMWSSASESNSPCVFDDEWRRVLEPLLRYCNQEIDPENVWDLAESVCQTLEFSLHETWKRYLNELFKLPWTTVHLTFLQFSERSDTLVNRIIQALYAGFFDAKLSIPDAAVPCSEEFARKYEEPMNIDMVINQFENHLNLTL